MAINIIENASVDIGAYHERQKRSRAEYYDDSPGNAETQRLFVKLDTLRNGSDKHCILITSSVLGEGKSTIAFHIALASARNRGNSTLLVDFDLRRPRIHHLLDMPKELGVAEVLANKNNFGECVKNTFIDNLKVLTAGTLETSPLEVFNSDTANKFFENARTHFDYIVVDSPPVIPVSDPLTLAKFVDNVVFVVRAGHTARKIVQRALDVITSAKVEVAGLIMNNVDNVLPSYFDPKYYGYQYYSYK